MPFRGGKKHQPQDSYSLRCIPQVHGAVRDAVEQAKRVLEIELNAVTDNPLVFPDKQAEHVEEQVISAGHFHGMPLALAMSYVKAAIPVLASISASNSFSGRLSVASNFLSSGISFSPNSCDRVKMRLLEWLLKTLGIIRPGSSA